MTDDTKSGDRIAKVMARAGVASRRDAERMIIDGRVTVNGVKIASPALDVKPSDKVTLDGKPIDAPQPARLWLYYKPLGLVTSDKDEKGRQTVFDTMPEGMPRVMSVGRLDLNSEGLLLLTNDGGLKRRLELPSTGWLRKYRVRVNGRPSESTFDPLRRGVTIDGEIFLPMEISLDKQQGANAWLTVGLREGKNREVRRAMAEVGLIVNRLIRVSYGPFRLNTMKPGDVVEVKQRILRDQLGRDPDEPETAAAGRDTRPPRHDKARAPKDGRDDRKPRAPRDAKDFKPRTPRDQAAEGPRKPRTPRKPTESPDRDAPSRTFRPGSPRERPDSTGGAKNFGTRGPRTQEDRANPKARTARGPTPQSDGSTEKRSFRERAVTPSTGSPKPDRRGGPGDGPRGGRPGKPAGTKPGSADSRSPRGSAEGGSGGKSVAQRTRSANPTKGPKPTWAGERDKGKGQPARRPGKDASPDRRPPRKPDGRK